MRMANKSIVPSLERSLTEMHRLSQVPLSRPSGGGLSDVADEEADFVDMASLWMQPPLEKSVDPQTPLPPPPPRTKPVLHLDFDAGTSYTDNDLDHLLTTWNPEDRRTRTTISTVSVVLPAPETPLPQTPLPQTPLTAGWDIADGDGSGRKMSAMAADGHRKPANTVFFTDLGSSLRQVPYCFLFFSFIVSLRRLRFVYV